MPTVPYVSAAAFRAHPTYLDTLGLNVDSTDPDAQTAELTNLLLAASDWADSELDQPLGAHLHTQTERIFVGSDQLLKLHADHGPVLQVVSFGYGYAPTALTVLTTPTVWVEQDTNIVVSLATAGTVAWAGSLQFGSPGVGGDLFTQAVYVAGHAATVLADSAEAGDTTLSVADPTGIMPGGRYRIWDPGLEETVTVDPAWIPPDPSALPSTTAVTLLQPLRNAHARDHDFSGVPADLRRAVVLHTMSQLMRPGTKDEDEYPDNATSSTRTEDSRPTGMGLLKEARRTLANYARVR